MLTRFLFKEVFDELRDVKVLVHNNRKLTGYLMSAVSDLRAEVEAEKEVFAAGVAKIEELSSRLEAAHSGTSDEDIASVIAEMKANVSALSAAVTSPASAVPVEAQAPAEAPVEAPVANTETSSS